MNRFFVSLVDNLIQSISQSVSNSGSLVLFEKSSSLRAMITPPPCRFLSFRWALKFEGRNSLSKIVSSTWVSEPMIMSGCRLDTRFSMSAFLPLTDRKLMLITLRGLGNFEFWWFFGLFLAGEEQWIGVKLGDREATELKERLALDSGFWAETELRPKRSYVMSL